MSETVDWANIRVGSAEYDTFFAQIKAGIIDTGDIPESVLTNLENLPSDVLSRLMSDVNEFTESITPSAQKAVKGYAVVSFANIGERRLEQLKMLSLAGFLYHTLVHEYEDMELERMITPPKDSPEYADVLRLIGAKKLVIKQFLDDMFKFNPELHVRSLNWPWKDDVSRNILPDRSLKSALSNVVTLAENVNGSDDPTLTASRRAELLADTTLMASIKDARAYGDPKAVKIGDTYVPIPAYDVYTGWKAYEDGNADQLRDVLNDIYETKEDMRAVLRVYETYPGSQAGLDAATQYQREFSRKTGLGLYVMETDKWVIMNNTREKARRTNYDNQEALKGIIAEQEAAARFMELVKKKRVIRRKKRGAHLLASKMASSNRNVDKTLSVDERTQRSVDARRAREAEIRANNRQETSGMTPEEYFSMQGAEGALRGEDIEPLDEIDKLVEEGRLKATDVYENVDEDGIPLNAVQIDVLVNRRDHFEKRKIFVEEERTVSASAKHQTINN